MGPAFRVSPTKQKRRGEKRQERRVGSLGEKAERLEAKATELEARGGSQRKMKRLARRAGKKRGKAEIARLDLGILEDEGETFDESVFDKLIDLQRRRRHRTGFGIRQTFS